MCLLLNSIIFHLSLPLPLYQYHIVFYLYLIIIKKIEVQLIYSAVLVSGIQQSDPVIFPYKLLQDIEHSPLYNGSLFF